MEELKRKIEIMNKVQIDLDLRQSYFELTKKGNIKLIHNKYKTVYFTQKQFFKLFDETKSHNFYGVEV